MTFKLYKKFYTKDFIRVREICVCFSMVAFRKLKSHNVDFLYEENTKEIKVVEKGNRRIVNETSSNPFVSAVLSRYMPMGRYFVTKEGNYKFEEKL